MIDIKKTTEELIKKWYKKEEINKTIQWLKDEKEWETYTAEEVHHSLFAKTNEYA